MAGKTGLGPGRQKAGAAKASVDGRHNRRTMLAGAAAAAGALAAHLIKPPPALAVDVVLGGTNNAATPTVIQNTAASTFARGVVGRTTFTGSASASAGVWGESLGQNGIGVLANALSGTTARGVQGTSTGTGVFGSGGPTGVYGIGSNYGVRGKSANNFGVYGEAGYAGVFGSGPYGVYGSGTSAGAIGTSGPGYGFYGLGSIGGVGIGDGNGYGLWGYNADSGGYGVVGQGGYRGVYGSGGNAGVFGTSGYVGVWGNASTTSGLNFGVYGYSGSSGGYAGVFSGRVQVSGFLTKLGGGFKVDHPLEPGRRYLVHSFVEAPEMLNVYSGTVALDSRGRATVRLPRYFGAANADHRYQLTPVGGPAPGLHVAKRIARNRFAIAGGTPGLAVCWQVTGVRQDAWAKANRLRVEPLKRRSDRGKYLCPTLYGKPEAEAILALPRNPSRRPRRRPKPPSIRENLEVAGTARKMPRRGAKHARRKRQNDAQKDQLRASLGELIRAQSGQPGGGKQNGRNGHSQNGHGRHPGGVNGSYDRGDAIGGGSWEGAGVRPNPREVGAVPSAL